MIGVLVWGVDGLRSIIILGVPFGFDESLGEWRVAGWL